MSFDLFQREANEAVARMPAVMEPEPGITENFFKGAGMATMRTFAKTARGIDALGAVPAILEDKIEAFRTGQTAQGVTTMQDKYFKEHDEVWNSAVDYWTPKPNEVGIAGEVVGQLAGMLPTIIASPALAVGAQLMDVSEDLVRKGVPADKAVAAGAVQAAGLGLGIWMPILGQNLWQRIVLGGAGFNVAQGVGTRAATQLILGDNPASKEFEVFDGKALTLDLLLGMAFGGVAHISPAMRAQGKEVWSRVESWARDLPPSDKDAIAVLRVAEHLNKDSLPGEPVGPEAIESHVEKMRAAVEQLITDKPVEVSDVGKPAGVPPVAEGMVRYYHGGNPEGVEGPLWFTSHLPDAEGWATRGAGMGVWYVDVPKDDPRWSGDLKNGIAPMSRYEMPTEIANERVLLREPSYAPDPARVETAVEQVTTLNEEAARIAVEEGIEAPAPTKQAKRKGKQRTEGPAAKRGDLSPPPRGDASAEAAGLEADPMRSAADDVAASNPDLKIIVGQDADGAAVEVPISEYLASARAEAKALRDDIPLLEAAATCLLGGGV